MSQIEEIVHDDFNPEIPFDPTDIMQLEIKNNVGSEEE